MITDFIGKLLFPHLQRGQRRHEMHVVFASLLVGLILAGIIAGVMILAGKTGGH